MVSVGGMGAMTTLDLSTCREVGQEYSTYEEVGQKCPTYD